MVDHPVNNHVGKRARRRRMLLGLTLEDVGEKIGIRYQQVQKYEIGAHNIRVSRLYDLAKALIIRPAYFFEGLPSTTVEGAPLTLGEIQLEELTDLFVKLNPEQRERLLDMMRAFQRER